MVGWQPFARLKKSVGKCRFIRGMGHLGIRRGCGREVHGVAAQRGPHWFDGFEDRLDCTRSKCHGHNFEIKGLSASTRFGRRGLAG